MYLIQCIWFGSWKVRRLNWALGTKESTLIHDNTNLGENCIDDYEQNFKQSREKSSSLQSYNSILMEVTFMYFALSIDRYSEE